MGLDCQESSKEYHRYYDGPDIDLRRCKTDKKEDQGYCLPVLVTPDLKLRGDIHIPV